jgi:hypothetical protein
MERNPNPSGHQAEEFNPRLGAESLEKEFTICDEEG